MDWNNQRFIDYCISEIKKVEDVDKKPLNQPFERYAQLTSICADGLINDKKHKWEYKKYTDMVKAKCIEMVGHKNKNVPKWRSLYWETLRAETYDFFESFLYFMEMKRPFEKKFYEPREKTLKTVVKDLQDLEDGVYKFYGLSLPARTGKSTISIFFLTWIALRHPESHSAMGGHSGILAEHFYDEYLELITSGDYTFKDLYQYWHPDGKGIVDKSAEHHTISFESTGDFPTLSCVGIDGTWTGAIDISADGYLYVDDLVRDRAHSLSPKRMNDTFSEYLNKMVDRMNAGAKQLMVGTLWNVLDPLMRLEEMYSDNPLYLFRRIPALDYETDESNFDYAIKGFPTQHYRDLRDQMIKSGNAPEWWAKYQQKPYKREGLLLELNELGYYNGILPVKWEYEYVVVCDVAFGGGDNVSMPIGLKDKKTNIIYVIGWYYSSAGVKVTVPDVADMLISNDIHAVTFERNNGGLLYAKLVNEELQKKNYICLCETKPAPNNISKEDKIKSCEAKIKTMIKFHDGSNRPTEIDEGYVYYPRTAMYEKALNDMSTFVTIGKNITDDAADSIAQMVLKAYGDVNQLATVETIDRSILGF